MSGTVSLCQDAATINSKQFCFNALNEQVNCTPALCEAKCDQFTVCSSDFTSLINGLDQCRSPSALDVDIRQKCFSATTNLQRDCSPNDCSLKLCLSQNQFNVCNPNFTGVMDRRTICSSTAMVIPDVQKCFDFNISGLQVDCTQYRCDIKNCIATVQLFDVCSPMRLNLWTREFLCINRILASGAERCFNGNVQRSCTVEDCNGTPM